MCRQRHDFETSGSVCTLERCKSAIGVQRKPEIPHLPDSGFKFRLDAVFGT